MREHKLKPPPLRLFKDIQKDKSREKASRLEGLEFFALRVGEGSNVSTS